MDDYIIALISLYAAILVIALIVLGPLVAVLLGVTL